jgi:hypothetical protein
MSELQGSFPNLFCFLPTASNDHSDVEKYYLSFMLEDSFKSSSGDHTPAVFPHVLDPNTAVFRGEALGK